MKKDVEYNSENLKDYVKFYNIGNGEYKTVNIKIDNEKIENFLKEHDISKFDFITASVSIYLSRADQTKGCLFKTVDSTGKEILLKTDYIKDSSFIDYSKEIETIDYINNLTFYSIYDTTNADFNNDALSLNINDDHLILAYSEDLFRDIYIQHMAANIETLINDILDNPNQRICDADILSDWDKELLEEFCYGKYVDFDKNKTLAMAFHENAANNPDRIAVDDGIDQITYGEMERLTNSLAYDLNKNYGIEYKDNIAVMLPRNYHFIELGLTLNKIGATFIPVDSEYPLKRIEHMMNISESKYIITTKEFADLHDYPIELIFIEDLNRDFDNDYECKGNGEDIFAILFTSGTTGAPKGVTVSNKQISGVAVSLRLVYKSKPGDVSGCYLSFGFGATFRMYFALYFAETVRIYNDKECDDIVLLIESLKNQPLNDLILPPDLGVTIYDYDEEFDVKNIILTGTKVNNLPKKDRGIPLFNMYGTSETLMAFIGQLDIDADAAPIGKPIANTWSYILDENKKPVPIGVLGDLYISRDFMSPGYYGREDLTNKAFMDNPYSTCEDNEIMYHTGDVAFFNFDGEIDILGRSDDQLSVRGFRVESEEIKKIMKEFPEVADIYLDVENDNLSAYYTTTGKVDIEEVKKALEIELPQYMIPTLFMEMEELPMNFNAKVDKFALRKMVREMKKVEDNVEIDDEILQSVVDRFKEVLKVDSVSVNDKFVSLGGNSLSAIKLQLQLKEKLEVNLPSNELMELSTPKNIADAIKANLDTDLNIDDSNYTFDDVVPLSESQLNVYLDESVNEMDTSYNNGFKIELDKSHSIEEIKNAIDKLFEAFPILKARVINSNDVISFSFDAQVEIREGTQDDAESFIRPFELDKNLSRFLIVEKENTNLLFMDCHHLIFDGTSLNNIFGQLTSILDGKYDGFVDNGVLRQISFDESITSEYMDEASQFFDLMLADRDEAYDLLPTVDSDDENEFYDTVSIDKEYLTSFLKENSITHNQFFTSVFAYALSRFTGSEKALFKIIEDGRGHIDLSESVGMFVRTLPLLIDCRNQNITSFLKDSASLINSTMKYDLYPFRILANKFDLNSNIYFQYAHSIFNNTYNLDVVELKHRPFGDFSFFIMNSDENSFRIKVAFSEKYTKDMVERFVEIYKLILDGMTIESELANIDFTLEDDMNLLDSYNQTEHDLEYGDILDGFADSLSKFPDSKLVLSDDASYTYGEGAYIINQIQTVLKENDIGVNDKVCVFVERNHWVLLSNVSALSLGASYVPIDENLPDSRIEYMIEKSKSKAIIVTDAFEKRATEIVRKMNRDITIINVSSLNEEVEKSDKFDYVDSSLNDVACILFTSGTTGNPKAVQVGRFSITNMASFYKNNSNFTSEDVYGVFASVGFDVSLQHYAALLCGGTVTWVPNDIRLNIDELNRYFIKYGVTHTIITTQVSKLFVDTVKDTTIKNLCAVGEKMGIVTAPDDYEFVDVYGPTEATSSMTSINVKDKIDASSVGCPDWNTKIYVLDAEKRRVPFGATGELYISGYQVSKGYLNDAEKTAAAFFENPFDGEINGYKTIYKTGDVVRLLCDGTIGFIGRNDSQVKIRGNRVELTEIESAIRELDNIEDVTVQTVNNGANNEVVAYVVTDMDEDDAKGYVCDHVAEIKPDYMVPSFVIKLDSIPLNVNGKVDKRALPEVDLDSLHAEYVAPENVVERDIVEAFEKVFNQERISIHDDFIRLGGDSLAAIKLLAYLDDYDISAIDVLSLHTPHAIAKNIKKESLEILDNYTLDGGCPLNESQLNLYLDIISKNKVDSYLIPSYMRLSKDYDINSIIDALNETLIVHPILKMCIKDNFDIPYLVNGSEPSIDVESDISEDYITEFLTRPFDLYDSLSRFLIIENQDSYSLFAVFHHIIVDALSEVIFKQDLQAILDGESVDIDDSFLKVSAFSQQIQKSDEYLEAKNFYNHLLSDVDEAGLLLDSVFGNGPGIEITDLELDYSSLKSFLEQNAITENTLFTSAFAYTLSRFAGNDKVYFNIAENGRERFNNYSAVGMYINTLPMLVDCKNQNVSSFVEDVSNLIYDVMKYNFYPFRLLVSEYNIDSHVIFNYLPEWINHRRDFDSTLMIEEEELIKNMNDLAADFHFELIKNDEKFVLRIIYSDRYSGDFVKRFSESYNLVLQEMICADSLKDMNYTSCKDIEFLDSYNQTEHDLDYKDVLDAFNDNLSKYPHKRMASFKDVSYTYGEGAFIADKIAKILIEHGIGPNDCVGFLTERNEYYVLCALAIMSTGAVCVPLDDAHPDDRIAFMIKDTSSKLIIVSDETIKRAKALSEDSILLNISYILGQTVGTIDHLPVVYSDLACILYTSGTTGLPKGVKITRKSILNISQYYRDTYALNTDDVYGLYASIGFDVAIFGIFSSLYVGACLSVIPGDIRLDMDRLNNYYIKQKITHTVMTTQVAKLFISHVGKTSLKFLITGGEKLGEFKGPEDYTLVDVYGPTESFMFTNSVVVNEKIDYTSVGFLNYNVKTYILDGEGRRVPFGAVGELYIAGYQVAQGYLNLEEDRKSFLDNPFDSDENYNRLYRTGDVVRYLPDGSLGIVGRQDSQVKIRGNRVELPEIENEIRELDYIEDVTVQTVKNGYNNDIVAYVVVSGDLAGDSLRDAVQDFVGKTKPDYMIPSYVIELDKIPLNVNGKVDKRALPEITIETRDYEDPQGYLEIVIANAFSQVLNIEKISRNDKFSALGGNSIDVISLISKLSDLNIHITVKDVIDEQTVKKIAKKAEYKISTDEISQESFEGFVDPTPTTDYFWKMNLKKPSYFLIPSFIETTKKIDRNLLEKSMMDVVNYHDMLRAIVKDKKLFVRPQNAEGIFTIEYCHISNITEETERINKEIDIFNGPLIKLAIFEDKTKDYLYMCFHRLIVDANSLRIIVNDLNLAYAQREHDMETELYNKTSSYQNYALAIEEYKTEKVVLKQKPYWENTLRTLKELRHTKINPDIVERDSIVLRLPSQISSILFTNAPNYYNCSIRGLFLAMLVKSWNDVMGEDEVSVRLFQDDRKNFSQNVLIERTVGWIDSSYPVILKNEGDKNKEIIANIEKTLKNVPNKGFDYPALMGIETEELPMIDFGYVNEFNLIGGGKMFNLKHNGEVANFTAPENNSLCDITVYGFTINNETFFILDYNTKRFTRKTMEEIGLSFIQNIDSAITFTGEDNSEDAYIFSNHPDKKKLFFVHSANFGSEYFYYMAQKLKDDYSFIVLEPYNRNHKENQLSSIEEFAAKYIEIIKSIQPEGPYYIGGYCFGGIIAHEMAVQLKKQGEKVDKLILLETYYIGDKELQELALGEQILFARDFLKDGILSPKHESIEDMISYTMSSVNIMYNYIPNYYDGDVIYFKAAVRSDEIKNEVFRRLDDFFNNKKAGGYEDFYNNEKLRIVNVPVSHDYLLNDESLKILIPELIKFIEGD